MGGLKGLILIASALAGMLSGASMGARAFRFIGVSNRLVTPNGDGRNDNVAFRFDNPRDSAGSLKIYDIRGAQVASLTVESGTTAVVWDAKSRGTAVRAGVYIYVLQVEGVTRSGSVVVIR